MSPLSGSPLRFFRSGIAASSVFDQEPAGAVPILVQPYDTRLVAGMTTDSSPRFSIVTDPTAPYTPSNVAQVLFPTGYAAGVSGTNEAFWQAFPSGGLSTVYFCIHFKISSNWYGHPTSGVNKICYLGIDTTSAPGTNGRQFYLSAQGIGAGALEFQPRLQGIAIPHGGSLSPVLYANQGNPATCVRNGWHKVQGILVRNTPGVADGQVHFWVDSLKTHAYTDIGWGATGSVCKWKDGRYQPIWGGTGGTVPADQWQWVDNLYVSGIA